MFKALLQPADIGTRPLAFMVWSLIAIVILAGLPVYATPAATGIAQALGCTLNEGDSHPCLLFGVDIGDLLYFLLVVAWPGLLTLPGGALALMAWLVTAIVVLARHWRTRSQSGPA